MATNKSSTKKNAPAAATTAPAAQETTVTIDGVEYVLSKLSAPVQNAIGILNVWNSEKGDAERKLLQLQHAIQSMSVEIARAVKAETAPATDDPVAA